VVVPTPRMTLPATTPSPPADDRLKPRARAFGWVVALWTALVLALALWGVQVAQRSYREQAQAAALARLNAVKDTLTIAFQQWAALPASLARRPAVLEFLGQPAVLRFAALPAAEQQQRYESYLREPAVLRMDTEIDTLARDFGLPFIAVIEPGGLVVANTSSFEVRRPTHLRSREYVVEALRGGAATQFLFGRVSSVPGIYFARRIESDQGPLGVVVVKQDAEVINRLLAGADGHGVVMTDANGVIVLGNRPELLLRRLPGAPPPRETGTPWQELYQRLPEPLPWRLETLPVGNTAASGVRLGDDERYLVNSAALPGLPLTVWVLAPLGEERELASAIGGAALLAWLLGAALLWLGWRRAQWLEQALAAQREAGRHAAARQAIEQRFAAVFEHASAGFLFFTPQDGVTHWNPATLKLFGVPDGAALAGRVPWFPPLSPELQADGQPSRERAIALMGSHQRSRERVQACEWRFRRSDGSLLDTEVAVIALEWDAATPQFCAVVQDVTARKQAEAATQEARAAAEAASQTKSSFLANMSHELRTPMNAIIGMTHLALEDGLPPRQRDYVEKANGAARNLLQILNDILDLSKIEAGQMELERIDFALDTVVGEMADVLGLKADEKGLELLFSAAPDLPPRLVGDPTRLRQVLVNLGSNAIKFTERGEVTIGMALQAQQENEVELHAWVRDTGVGLDTAQIARLFQPFVQVDSSTTRRHGGTGLGLVISRQLVERMGGKLWVESRPGVGSTFHFSARFGRSATPAPARAWTVGELRGRRALLVDDSAAALDVLANMLEHLGVQVDRAASGARALALFEAAPPGAYTWVLVDWKMPAMDGVACARAILGLRPSVPPCVLLVTAFGREAALRAAGTLPLAGVLQKPVTPSTLYDCLLHALPEAASAAPARLAASGGQGVLGSVANGAQRRLAGARILLVEDHPLNQELARELLERAGMQVVLAENGVDALQRLADAGPFDGVLMDCQMPVLDGYSTTRQLRQNPAWEKLPVIAMTASALAEDRERALASGMNAHITKPINVELMLQTMAQWMGRPAANGAPATVAPASDWPPAGLARVIDTRDGMARCLGKPELYRRLLDGFRQAKAHFGADLQAALAQARDDDAFRAVHDLKGLAGTIGALALQASAQDLQHALATPERDATIARVLADLDAVLGEIDALLAQA